VKTRRRERIGGRKVDIRKSLGEGEAEKRWGLRTRSGRAESGHTTDAKSLDQKG
jgi:hypothetical protein